MSVKTIFVVIISVLVTVVLMNNTEEIDFWIFGDARVPKLTILGVMFVLGLIVGFLAGRPKKAIADSQNEENESFARERGTERESGLSDEDRDYIR